MMREVGSPFYLAFLHSQTGYLCYRICRRRRLSMGTDRRTTAKLGSVRWSRSTQAPGVPTELCWASVSSDDRMVYATNFGYSNICSYRINGNKLEIAKDPACPKVPGDGTARALNGTVTSGPSDSWFQPG